MTISNLGFAIIISHYRHFLDILLNVYLGYATIQVYDWMWYELN